MPIFGFRDSTAQLRWDELFLLVPDAKLAGEHLKTLTAAPHWASSPEDYATAQYVEAKFKAAGLQTTIVPYRVLLNKPVSIQIEAFDAEHHLLMSGPTSEHVDPKGLRWRPLPGRPPHPARLQRIKSVRRCHHRAGGVRQLRSSRRLRPAR